MGFQDRGRALWENRPAFSGFNIAMFDIYQIGRGLTPRRGGNKGTLGVTADQRADTRQELLTPVCRRRAFQRSRGGRSGSSSVRRSDKPTLLPWPALHART
jgi:hypothetical protein